MGRTHPENPFWIFCCCGGLPIIGLIKGAIVVGPILILSLISFNGCSIILVPHDIFLTYRALFKTSLIGINLKILGLFLLPIALVVWIIVVLLGSILFGIFFGLFNPVVETFDEKSNIFYGGFYETFDETIKMIKKFWEFNYKSYFTYLYDIEKIKCDNPFDINIIQLIIEIILTAYGSVIGVLVLFIMYIIKLFPSIIRMYYLMYKFYLKLTILERFMYIIFFIIGLSLVPVVGIISVLAYIGDGLYGGILCAIEGYKYNFKRGLISIWDTIRKADMISNKMIFDTKYSCFPDCSETFKVKEKKDNIDYKNI